MRSSDEITADAEPRSAFSNGTEYEIWAGHGRGCYDCAQDDPNVERYCPILSVGFLGSWPKEWTRRNVTWEAGDRSGSYEIVDECTEFERRRDDGPDDDDPGPEPVPPAPEVEGQTDIFEVFAQQIADEASTARPAEVAR